MNIADYVKEAMHKTGLSQNEIAARIGMSKQNLSGAIHGRRPFPASAAIYLAELCGRNAREIWEAIKKNGKQAACIALTVGMTCGSLLFPSTAEAAKDQAVTGESAQEYKLSRFMRWAGATVKRLLRGLAGSLVKDPAFADCEGSRIPA